MLTSSGYVTDASPELRRILTVRPLAIGDRPPPAAFRVFRESGKHICVPQYFGKGHIGERPVDRRVEPARANIEFIGKLRQELNQEDALSKAKEAMERGGGVLSLPCGYGKSIVGLAIAAEVGLRTMIMVHKEFLADQWTEVIRRFCPGSTIGRVQGDKMELENDFVICLIQTMCAREHPVRSFESIGLLIVDEAHHICAKVFSQTMFKMCPKFTIGLSATPERKDGLTRVLHWFLGPMFFAIQRKSNAVQIQEIHYMGPFPEMSTKPNMPEMITDLCQIPERNKVLTDEIDKLLQTDRNILVLTDRRAHCGWILEHYGEVAGLYIGGLAREALEKAAKKRLIIGTFSLAQEGLDIPKLDTVIFATPKADIVQASGRILRSQGNSPLIIDIIDHWCMFNSMFYKRRKQYIDMGFMNSEQPKRCLL